MIESRKSSMLVSRYESALPCVRDNKIMFFETNLKLSLFIFFQEYLVPAAFFVFSCIHFLTTDEVSYQ